MKWCTRWKAGHKRCSGHFYWPARLIPPILRFGFAFIYCSPGSAYSNPTEWVNGIKKSLFFSPPLADRKLFLCRLRRFLPIFEIIAGEQSGAIRYVFGTGQCVGHETVFCLCWHAFRPFFQMGWVSSERTAFRNQFSVRNAFLQWNSRITWFFTTTAFCLFSVFRANICKSNIWY